MELLTACKFAEYKIFSRHRKGFGIHSPFVFNLITTVFRNKTDPEIVSTVENIRNRLIKDTRLINVNDLGSGSGNMKTGVRRVADIARYCSIPPKYGILLSNMARAFGGSAVVELGTSLGISTMYMAASCGNTTVYTIEGSPEVADIARAGFEAAGLGGIRLLKGSFDDMLPEIRKENICPGLVFIDGDHRKEPLLRYFGQIAEMSDDRTVVIIDDIYRSGEMAEAWNEIKNDRRVSVTIDIFRMGLLFFRKGIYHMNYVIRY